MRCGVSVPNGGDPAQLVELAVTAEAAGWDGLFLWDHVNALPEMHDPWVVLDTFLRGERVDHDGEHYSVHAKLGPPAVQRPRPPSWAAATVGADRPLARARQVDGIFPQASQVRHGLTSWPQRSHRLIRTTGMTCSA